MSTRKKIVMIDDEADFCFFVKNNLEHAGAYEVLTASDGKAGMALIAAQKPDLVLLDVVMPEVSGPDVADFLLHEAASRKIPFIFLTAIVTKDEIGTEPMREIKGHVFLQKPIDIDTLKDSINSVLEKSEQERRIDGILSGGKNA